MLKTMFLIGTLLIISFSSMVVIKDWDNSENVKIVSYGETDVERCDIEIDIFPKQNVEPYQLKEVLPYKRVSNGIN